MILYFADIEKYDSSREFPLYRAQILRVGEWDYIREDGEVVPLVIDRDHIRKIIENFGVIPPYKLPVDAYPAHSDSDEHDRGFIVQLEPTPDFTELYAIFDIRDPVVAKAIDEGRLLYCSAEISLEYVPADKSLPQDPTSVLLGMSLTNRPFIGDLSPIEKLACESRETMNENNELRELQEKIARLESEVRAERLKNRIIGLSTSKRLTAHVANGLITLATALAGSNSGQIQLSARGAKLLADLSSRLQEQWDGVSPLDVSAEDIVDMIVDLLAGDPQPESPSDEQLSSDEGEEEKAELSEDGEEEKPEEEEYFENAVGRPGSIADVPMFSANEEEQLKMSAPVMQHYRPIDADLDRKAIKLARQIAQEHKIDMQRAYVRAIEMIVSKSKKG